MFDSKKQREKGKNEVIVCFFRIFSDNLLLAHQFFFKIQVKPKIGKKQL